MFVLEYEYAFCDYEILFSHDSKEFLEKIIQETKSVESKKKNIEDVEEDVQVVVRYFSKNNYKANFFKIFEMQSYQEFLKDRFESC